MKQNTIFLLKNFTQNYPKPPYIAFVVGILDSDLFPPTILRLLGLPFLFCCCFFLKISFWKFQHHFYLFLELFLEKNRGLADMWEELNSLLKSICMCFWAHAKKIPSDSAKFINLDMPRIYQKQENKEEEPFFGQTTTVSTFKAPNLADQNVFFAIIVVISSL